MKYLYVMRHARAESALSANSQTDIERQLTSEGEKDARLIGSALQQLQFRPERLLISPAKRTLFTAHLLNRAFASAPIPEQQVDPLYNASLQTLLSVIYDIPDEINSVLVLAHNPGVSQLVQYFLDSPLPTMNAGSLYLLLFQVTQWNLVSPRNGEYGFFISPHALQQD